jgi:UDP-N-acetylmuramyl pentapeptide synthase
MSNAIQIKNVQKVFKTPGGDVVALKESLERYKPKGYYILIKGSNSMKLSQLQEIL